MEKQTITEETTATVKDLAVILGLSERRIRQLAEDKIFERVERGRYLLADSVQAYFTYATKNDKSEEDITTERQRRAAEAKLKEARASIESLRAAELRGKMHRSEDVQAFTQSLVDTIKNALLSLPGRMSVELSLCETAEECSLIVKDTVKDVLRELSEFEYDPDKYAAAVREREKLQEVEEEYE